MATTFHPGTRATFVARSGQRPTAIRVEEVEVVSTQTNGWVLVVGQDRTRPFAIAPGALTPA